MCVVRLRFCFNLVRFRFEQGGTGAPISSLLESLPFFLYPSISQRPSAHHPFILSFTSFVEPNNTSHRSPSLLQLPSSHSFIPVLSPLVPFTFHPLNSCVSFFTPSPFTSFLRVLHTLPPYLTPARPSPFFTLANIFAYRKSIKRAGVASSADANSII